MAEKKGGILDGFSEGVRLFVMAVLGGVLWAFVQGRDQQIADHVKLEIAYERMKEIVPREENEKRWDALEVLGDRNSRRIEALEEYLRQQKKNQDAGFSEKSL
jgi:hypothetical protein